MCYILTVIFVFKYFYGLLPHIYIILVNLKKYMQLTILSKINIHIH